MPLVPLDAQLERSPASPEHRIPPAVVLLCGPALIGVLAMAALVVAAGRAATPVGVVLEPSFGGLLSPSTTGGTASPVGVLIALATLVTCWWRVLRLAAHGTVGLRAVGATGGLWLLPVLVAPPLLSLDAYAYLAQGAMLANGLDPYSGGPVLLGDDPAIARVDPMWRASPVPYGPLTLLLLRAVAVSQGDLLSGVLLLRIIALLGVAAAVAVALRLTPATRCSYVLALCALNPVTLVHLIGGAHIDAVLAGVVALCLLGLHQGRPWLSWLLAASAVAVKITAAPLLLFIFIGLARRYRLRVRVILLATGLAVLPYVAALLVVDRPWGIFAALSVPGSSSPWYAPATIAGNALVAAGHLLSVPVDDSVLRWAGRLVVLVVGGLVVLALLRAERDDSGTGWSRRSAQRIALALLVVPLCLPALYAWYLGAGLFVLAAVGDRARTTLIVALSSALLFSSLPPLYAANRWPLAAAWLLALTILAVGASGRRRALDAVSGRMAAIAHEASPAGHHGWVRLAQAAGLGLLAPLAVGLLSPGASADVVSEQARSERVGVIRQLTQDYPRLQIVRVLPATEPSADYAVDMVKPAGSTCKLLLARGIGPRAPFVRADLGAPPAVGSTAAIEACPPPAWARPTPDHLGSPTP